jgi:hypothetical protein
MILNILFDIGKLFAFGFLLNDYLKRNYENHYNYFLITFIYKLFYFYSQSEILFNKTTKYIIDNNHDLEPFINNLKQFFNNKANRIENLDISLIKENKLIKKINKNNVIPEIDFDYLLYHDISNLPNNIKIIKKNNFTYNIDNEELYKYEISDIKFILVELELNSKFYKIDLHSDKYNFYVSDNIFDKSFFIYCLNYFYKDDDFSFINDETIIHLKIIDQNVMIVNIDLNTELIQIIKNNYIITSN